MLSKFDILNCFASFINWIRLIDGYSPFKTGKHRGTLKSPKCLPTQRHPLSSWNQTIPAAHVHHLRSVISTPIRWRVVIRGLIQNKGRVDWSVRVHDQIIIFIITFIIQSFPYDFEHNHQHFIYLTQNLIPYKQQYPKYRVPHFPSYATHRKNLSRL